MPASPELLALADRSYVSLVTFRTTGVPVATPVWLARHGDSLIVTTADGTGKVKRLRSTIREPVDGARYFGGGGSYDICPACVARVIGGAGVPWGEGKLPPPGDWDPVAQLRGAHTAHDWVKLENWRPEE